MNNAVRILLGGLVGVLLGYPVSYWFQSAALRQKLSIGEYISHIGDVFKDKDLVGVAIGVWVLTIVVCSLAGLLVGKLSAQPKS